LVSDFNQVHGDKESIAFGDDAFQAEMDFVIATFDDFFLRRRLELLLGKVI
jgi:hypothetical protein